MRRTNFRLDKINYRLEILSGYLTAYLNLDRIIEIIRGEDDAKAVMIKEFALTDNQAEAILNMKLRSLRKLEESQIKEEYDELSEEKDGLESLLSSEDKQWQAIAEEIRQTSQRYICFYCYILYCSVSGA